MSNPQPAAHWKALRMLLLANLCWGLSFPTMKALGAAQQAEMPGQSSWFFAALCITYRFGIAAAVMLFCCRRTLRNLSNSEISQGVGLGLFAAGGLVFQMDGLSHTAASTSAFLTQCYCVIIPAWVAIQERRFPSKLTILSCILVVAGVAVLSELHFTKLSLGRGEIETIVASIIFTGQILWLQRPCFSNNNVLHFTLVMFLTIAVACAPIAVLTSHGASDLVRAYASPASSILLAILIVFCTFSSYLLMNRWQPHLTAVQAGLIYCVEPLFASVFSLFLPAWFSTLANIHYANETVTASMLVGGGLITAANILIQLEAPPEVRNSTVIATAAVPEVSRECPQNPRC